MISSKNEDRPGIAFRSRSPFYFKVATCPGRREPHNPIGSAGQAAHRPPVSDVCSFPSTSCGSRPWHGWTGDPEAPRRSRDLPPDEPRFTDGWFLGLMVSDVVSSLPSPMLQKGNERHARSGQAREAWRAVVAPARAGAEDASRRAIPPRRGVEQVPAPGRSGSGARRAPGVRQRGRGQ